MVGHRSFSQNSIGRDYIVGDLHGCFDALKDSMEDIAFDQNVDRMFSVGDLADRGKQNMACLRLIKEPWFHAVIGNHEVFMMESILDGADPTAWVMNGGSWHQDVDLNELWELAQYVRTNIPYAITVDTPNGRVGICHAEPPSEDWADALDPSPEMVKRMIWGRTWIRFGVHTHVKGVYKTIHGHTSVQQVIHHGNAYFIDTGAVYGDGFLTVVSLSEMSPSGKGPSND